ncbi:hypothetical protein CNECB9_4530003 [Cupriavidus necator]|uniref:AMP-binding enzyme C-terminal domain-containing protein n=1 Tax=Cupriavidus necator TaxID=106590 RepID=A0A1K0JGH4_CUPNE|nr:hypothetical protein CNECB9_4530003 [Cupriavidus necator]
MPHPPLYIVRLTRQQPLAGPAGEPRPEYNLDPRPRRYHFLDALPKTTSGKIQKHMLRAGATA